MPKNPDKVNVAFPPGTIEEIESIRSESPRYLSVQEFVREAVREKLERLKREKGFRGV